MLAPTGSSLSPFITSLESLGSSKANNGQILANSKLFDSPLSVRNGVGYAKARRINAVWEEILERSIPQDPISHEDFVREEPKSAELLFRLPDRIDTARGNKFSREPSEAFLKYQEYRKLYYMFQSNRNEEIWKLHPELSKYVWLEDAEAEILKDWEKFGAKSEIDIALSVFDSRLGKWSAWSRVASNYKSKIIYLGDRNVSQPKTLLSPEPEAWLSSGNWKWGTSVTSGGKTIGFQYLKVQIQRDWFMIEELASGNLTLSTTDKFLVSDGKEPSLSEYPKGHLSVYPTNLILVRNIAVSYTHLTLPTKA